MLGQKYGLPSQKCGMYAYDSLMKEIKVEDPRAFANFVRMDAQQF